MKRKPKADKDGAPECPEMDGRGDKTPEYFQWMVLHKTEDAKEKYIGRRVCGELVTEQFIDEIVKRGGLPKRFLGGGDWKPAGTFKLPPSTGKQSGQRETSDLSMKGLEEANEGAGE